MSIIISSIGNVSRRSIQNVLTADSKEKALNSRTWKQWIFDGIKYVFTLNMAETHFKHINQLWDNIRNESIHARNDINKLCNNIMKLRNCIVASHQDIFDKSLRVQIKPIKTNSVKLYFVNSDEIPVYEFSYLYLDSLFCEDLENRLFCKIFNRCYNIPEKINVYSIRNKNIDFSRNTLIVSPEKSPKKCNIKLNLLEDDVIKLARTTQNYLNNTKKLCTLMDKIEEKIEGLKIITNQTRNKNKNKYEKAHKLKGKLKKYLKDYEPEFCDPASINEFIIKAEELNKEAEDFIFKFN